jgi:phenylalanyl-tRNA synthetase beta chain
LASGNANTLQWGHQEQGVDFFDIKGDVEALLAPARPVFEPAEHPAMHPGRCARVLLGSRAIGFVGELHPRWRQGYELAQAPVLFELELDALLERQVAAFRGVAKHQAVQRDIAVLVQESQTHADLLRAVWAAPTGGLLRDAVLFDIYRPKPVVSDGLTVEASAPHKSMALRLTLNSDEATLTEAQIETAMHAVLTTLVQQVGARQRA